MVIESMHEKTEEAMCKLLQALFRSFIISIEQMKNVSYSKHTECHNERNLGKNLEMSRKAKKFVKICLYIC